ncbi:hypothetical protein [Gemmatimonas phototrophica]|uniref:Glycosyl hydrolase family 98 putative carbohydrate-binding module domain-containing protein n=1 Tax=Gemmatimonas phototrophica TaxID=1379270 RepID=A0A143BM44_9BACT|nr:hypothetical protein [Gemmatimonas phototrophica]AMW05592.1 hypothetical protein GEMMAAP_13800 [Gemmatimonas phototrophica]
MRAPSRLLLPALALLVSVGPLVAARATPHLIWIGTAIGRDGATLRGDLEMFAGKADNTTFVELAIRKDVPGAARSWRVMRGSCATPRGAFADAGSFPLIRIGKEAKGVNSVTLPVALPDTGDFHVTVAASPTATRVLACGDLVLDD